MNYFGKLEYMKNEQDFISWQRSLKNSELFRDNTKKR